jgi:signal transduction histidine kinase/type II secretory pathway pseudopilin PulG
MVIRSKLLLVMLVVAILPLIVLTVFILSSSQAALAEKTKEALQTVGLLKKERAELIAGDPARKASLSATTIDGQPELLIKDDALRALTQDYTGLGRTGDILFAKRTDNGTVALSPSRFKNSAQADALQSLTPQITESLEKHSNPSGAVGSGSTQTLFSVHYVPAFDAALITTISTSEFSTQVEQLRDSVLVFALVFMLILVMIILFFVHSITGPIANLATVAKKAADGNLKERALVISKDEIGTLAITFNAMLDQLQESKSTLEKKVEERTQQLQETNKELESFSYSVSHDLRAPLRAMDGFSKILVEDYSDKLDSEGKRVLSTIINSTQQMGRLIDDLLAFSRLGRQEVKKQVVNMNTQVQGVFSELQQAAGKRKIEFKLADLPTAQADASLIHQVWSNLLSNALKYSSHKETAIIEVGATSDDHETIYFVKDNGAGFDMTYVDKLFGVFQRLHDQNEFEGTGVGLAIVKRIVARHGGRVWAEGKIDHGATMYFTLPNLR